MDDNSEKVIRDIVNMDEEDLKFAKAIREQFKCSSIEAENRIILIKKFALTHASRLGKNFNLIVDLIAEGSLIPTSNMFEFDTPIYKYRIEFDEKARTVEDGHRLRMDLSVNFLGNDYKICVMRKSDYDTIFNRGVNEKCS